MPVKKMGRVEFDEHLEELGIQCGMHLSVHSRLLSFGRVDGGAQAVFDILQRRVGEEGTLVFPTYTLNLGPDDIYDRETTPSHGMGVLAEMARNQPGVGRTLCPMHGHAVIGAGADVVMAADYLCSMGPGSAFQAMRDRGFHLLLLGCSFQEGATFVHHAEALHGVPYREWLALPRRIRTGDDNVESVNCRYYGRKHDSPWTTELSTVEEAVTRERLGSRLGIGVRSSYLVPLADLQDCVFRLLERDAYVLMRDTSVSKIRDPFHHVA